ncbi:hypothetical protein [Aneurinibacillus tyrosinisolvens]|uniref:hypothetical protein n=1 Tax=Aneurinibacillus tyrosinisolvens TaxID=1443435 RepID=UPI00063F1B34|nr:hypothetical protein [Aneurinibacillus tyrosinisolvens]
MKAEEIMRNIADLSNAERIRLLELLYERHFDNRPPFEAQIREKQREFLEEEIYEQGYDEGVRDAKAQVAKKLITRYPLPEIMDITELHEDEMLSIIKQYIKREEE